MPENPQAPLGRRELKKQATREALESAALRLYLRRGFDETTVEDITETVDVAPRRGQPDRLGPVLTVRRVPRQRSTRQRLDGGSVARYVVLILGLLAASVVFFERRDLRRT